jgi:DNA-binding transcriptional LysR family regulator
MDRLESMSVLVAAVEAGSLSAAARRLKTPLATVSRKVAELEAHLGTRLLNRSSRRLSVTDAGRAYVEVCRRLLEEIDELEKATMGEYSAPRGELTVTAPIVFGRLHVLPVVSDFLRAYPDIDVRLLLSDRVSNLLDEPVDAAVRIGELPDSSLIAKRLGMIGRVVCGSPGYLAERGAPKQPLDLARHACVTFEGLSSPSEWIFQGSTQTTAVKLRSRLVVSTAEAAVDAAVAGIGLTRVLSYQVAAAEAAGALVRVLRRFEPAAVPVSLVHSGQARLPLKLRAFIDFCAPRLQARLADAPRRGQRRARPA